MRPCHQDLLAARFPLLYARQRWDWGGIDAAFSTDLPADELVTNVHVVCFVGQQVVVCRDNPGPTAGVSAAASACASYS
jgi:hypothetical protein